MRNRAYGTLLVGIGGLPQASLEEALDWVLDSYDEVFRPQPPLGDGASGMLAECLPEGLPLAAHPGFGVKLDRLADDQTLAGFFDLEALDDLPVLAAQRRFLAALGDRGEGRGLKDQFAGPITILQSLRDSWSRPLWAFPEHHGLLARWCGEIGRRLAQGLKAGTDRAVVILDEPVLGLPGPREHGDEIVAILEPVLEGIRASGARAGLHCCSAPPLDLLRRLPIDELSLDAQRFGSELETGAPILADYLRGGGRLRLGIVAPFPTGADHDPLPLLRRIERSSGLRPEELVDRLALSPSCGTMLCPLDREAEIVSALRQARTRIDGWLEESR
ncbi:MAG: hypothetical protein H6807_00675 [Planctomycetes bacterium]|nr:hypothetical protein [Planctomycetota bacterium]